MLAKVNELVIAAGEEFDLQQVILGLSTEIERRQIPEPKPEGPWLVGGAVRRALMGQSLMECDWDYAANEYEDLKLAGPGTVTSTARTWRVTSPANSNGHRLVSKVQWLIKTRGLEIEDALETFDFSMSQVAYDGSHILVIGQAFIDIACRELRYNVNCKNPSGVCARVVRFLSEGWTLNQDEAKKAWMSYIAPRDKFRVTPGFS